MTDHHDNDLERAEYGELPTGRDTSAPVGLDDGPVGHGDGRDAHGNEAWLCSREVRLIDIVADRQGSTDDSADEISTDETGADETSADCPTLEVNPGEPNAGSGEAGSPDTGAARGRGVASGIQYAAVDPRELLLGPNVRTDVSLTKEFVASVRDRGVQEPITVRRRGVDGALVVRKGSRRTLAALEAGLVAVPVLIQPDADPGESDTDGQVERIIDQVEENDQRAANSAAEQIGAVQQLLDLGLSATAIARRTHRRPKVVRAQARVARSTLLAAAVSRYDGLTLDRAAAAADFDDGTDEGVEAVKALIVTAQKQPAQFDHVLQRLQDQRRQRRLLADKVAELAAAGVQVVAEEEADQVAPLTGLRPSAGDESGTELTEQAHRGCPGHAALLAIKPGWGGQPDEVITKWACTDPETHGHRGRFDGPTATTGVGAGGSLTGRDGSRKMTEQEKAERRTVVANNKDWDSATTVRRRWLRETFLPRRTAPKNAHQLIAATLARGGHPLRKAMEARHVVACELLGLPAPERWGAELPISTQAQNAGPSRATMLTLAILLGAAEQSVGRHTWRNPDVEAITYFTALQQWGYPLSPVEQLVLGVNAETDTGTNTEVNAEATPRVGQSSSSTTDGVSAHGTAGNRGTDEVTKSDIDADRSPAFEPEVANDPADAAVDEAVDGVAGEAVDDATSDSAAADGDAGGDEGSHSHAA